MNLLLWIFQGILVVVFLLSAWNKLVLTKEKLVEQMAWAEDFSSTSLKIIGVLELMAAIGLFLPAMLGILTVLTSYAAIGIVLIMISASVVHFRRREYIMVFINLLIMVIASIIARNYFDF